MAILENQGTRLELTSPTYEAARAPVREREMEKTAEVVAGGAGLEALCGAGAVVLAILGLVHKYPMWMSSISLIVLGAGMLFIGVATAARARNLFRIAGAGNLQEGELGGGLGAEFLGGCAGIVLGILAMINIHPNYLLPIGLIAVGGTLVLSAAATARLRNLTIYSSTAHPTAQAVARESVSAASGLQALVGIAGVVLGILALLGVGGDWMVLSLVGLLTLGGGLLLSGGALSGSMASVFRR